MRNHYIHASNISVLWAVSLCISLCGEATGTEHVTLRIEDLIHMAAASREGISSLDITYETEQLRPAGSSTRGIRFIKRRLLVDFANTFYYEEREAVFDDHKIETHALDSYDGEHRMLFLPNSTIGAIHRPHWDKQKLQRTLLERIPPLQAALMFPPKSDGVGPNDGSMVSLLKHGTLRPETETVDGCETYVVDAELNGIRYATVWLDIERGVIPLRAVMYGKTGTIVFDQTLTEITAFDNAKGNRVWLPLSIEYTTIRNGETVKVSKAIASDTLRINLPTEKSMFRITFPPNTTIHDSAIDMTYHIPGDQIDTPSDTLLDKSDTPLIGLNATGDSHDQNTPALNGDSVAQSGEPSASHTTTPIVEHQNRTRYMTAVCIVAVIAPVIAASLCYTRSSRHHRD